MRKRYTDRERKQLVEAVRSSGQPTRKVATQLGVSVSTAYLWVKRTPPETAPRFARLVRTGHGEPPSLKLEIGGAIIRVDKGFDSDLLRDVVEALGRVSA